MIDYKIKTPRHTQLLWLSGKYWLTVVFTGLLFFTIYITLVYIYHLLIGNAQYWAENSIIGFAPQDAWGNIIFGIHILGAAIISIGGPLQLIPLIRKRYPRFHRLNGRVYIGMAFLLSIGGLYLIWVRKASTGIIGDLSVSFNGILILMSALFTIKYAIARKIEVHNRWALRLFLSMSGVYFFRIILMFWIIINGGPIGFDPESFTGPAITIIDMLSYVFPLGVLEIFFWAHRTRYKPMSIVMIFFMALLTLTWVIGIGATILGMWWPAIQL